MLEARGRDRSGRGRGQPSLTHKHRDQKPTDPLLLDLLDLGCSPWSAGLAHDGEGVGVGDRAHSGGAEPGHPEDGGHPAHAHDQQQVQVEAGALDQLALRFADDQPGGVGVRGEWGSPFPTLSAPPFLPST